MCIRDEYIRYRPRKTKKGSKKPVLRSKWHDNLYYLEEALQQRDTREQENNQNQKKRAKVEDKSEQIPQQQTVKRQRYFRSVNEANMIKLLKDLEEKRSDLIKDVINKKEDELDLFCRHLGEVLRNLPPVYRAEAKKQISVMLSDYEVMAAKIDANGDTQQSSSSDQADAEMPESFII